VPPPLSGLRIAVTLPLPNWFGGVDYDFAIEMSDELRSLGAEVFELDVSPFIARNQPGMLHAIEAAKRFRADVAMSIPNQGYAMYCKAPAGENVLLDILQIPTIMLWDHGLLQLPEQILRPWPLKPSETAGGSIRRIRQILDHPLFVHYSPDRGHMRELIRLGAIGPDRVRYLMQSAYPNFIRYGYREDSRGIYDSSVAFAGNVYLKAARDLPFREPQLDQIEQGMLAAKHERLTEPWWTLLMEQIDQLDGASRKRLALDPDQSFFWRYVYDEIEYAGHTANRLSILRSLKRPLDFFGNFAEPESVSALSNIPGISFRRCLDYFTELPLLFRNSEVILDIVHAGFYSGVSAKIMGCFACGGLVLFDYKSDFREAFGEIADQVMYRNVDHLNALMERYLGDPRKRLDVSLYLQHRARTEFSFRELAKRILVDEPWWRKARR